ncbi:zinc finger protein 726-like [Neodiprion virginianus]|uniref:Zinc finger protein 726-like n=1 Tax=Neodiprion lecontei TaxID=441921 RepID=A0ABM3FNM9_NEOLC|nr:zinc finger protein 726-like [Neodiprion fabricii]XP_046472309.1 zinc finger protein 726-like [Neodiprion pinetum]XP_046589630.1 zinc finger protein 726-like [Neodiprion lecontei]XP_046610354.1 zinc finger protein 726-like [Neodiprion virginianus]
MDIKYKLRIIYNIGLQYGMKFQYSGNQYPCSDCGKSYSWKSSMERHRREGCGKQQSVKYAKRDPKRVNYDAPFRCYKCGKQYTWADSLTRHLREGCGKLPKYCCRLCGRKFKRKDYLQRHEVTVHKFEIEII